MIGEKFIKESSIKIDLKIPSIKREKNVKPINLVNPIPEDFFIKLITERRSVREYSEKPMSFEHLSFILYSASSISGERMGVKLRTYPSAGAKYPIDIYVAVFNVENLEQGIYKYNDTKFQLELLAKGDYREELYEISIQQDFVKQSAIMIILVARSLRSTYRYGERGIRYVLMDASYISSNIYLTSTYLNLGSCVIGSFADEAFKKFLNIKGDETFVVLAHTVGTIK